MLTTLLYFSRYFYFLQNNRYLCLGLFITIIIFSFYYMKKSAIYLMSTMLLLVSCYPTDSYLHLIFNITDNVKAVITIDTSRRCRSWVGDEEICMLALNISSEEEHHLKSITLHSAAQTIVGRVEIDHATDFDMHVMGGGSNTITMYDLDARITTTPTSFYVAMLPYAFANGDLSIDLEFEDGIQTVSLPAFNLERGMEVSVDCRL